LASTHRGAALFAIRASVPVILVVAIRRNDMHEILCEEVVVERSGALDDVVYRLVAAFTNRLEQVVRTVPEQYLWLHRRWKTRPPEEQAEASKV
jgi:KDO2-lipid IV(A) lauroyltransferase